MTSTHLSKLGFFGFGNMAQAIWVGAKQYCHQHHIHAQFTRRQRDIATSLSASLEIDFVSEQEKTKNGKNRKSQNRKIQFFNFFSRLTPPQNSERLHWGENANFNYFWTSARVEKKLRPTKALILFEYNSYQSSYL